MPVYVADIDFAVWYCKLFIFCILIMHQRNNPADLGVSIPLRPWRGSKTPLCPWQILL